MILSCKGCHIKVMKTETKGSEWDISMCFVIFLPLIAVLFSVFRHHWCVNIVINFSQICKLNNFIVGYCFSGTVI